VIWKYKTEDCLPVLQTGNLRFWGNTHKAEGCFAEPRNDTFVCCGLNTDLFILKQNVIARAFPLKNKRLKPEATFDVVIRKFKAGWQATFNVVIWKFKAGRQATFDVVIIDNDICLREFHRMANVSNIGLVKAEYFVYIMTNKGNQVLYTGVTSNLEVRCAEHISKKHPDSFTAKYNVNKLVYYERFDRIEAAIAREKQIKGGSRKKKIALVELMNPHWNDLYETQIGETE
jgi:putative endonuclease